MKSPQSTHRLSLVKNLIKYKLGLSKPKLYCAETLDDICAYYGWTHQSNLRKSDFPPSPGNLWQLNSRRFNDVRLVTTCSLNINGEIVEIGTSHGEMTARLATLNPGKTVFTLDVLPTQKNEGNHITHKISSSDIGRTYKSLGLKNVVQFLEDSLTWNPSISNIDLAFIDGCHDKKYVIRDTIKCASFMNKGGYIIWHDCNPDLSCHFHWLNSVQSAIEELMVTNHISKPVLYLKNSFTAITQL